MTASVRQAEGWRRGVATRGVGALVCVAGSVCAALWGTPASGGATAAASGVVGVAAAGWLGWVAWARPWWVVWGVTAWLAVETVVLARLPLPGVAVTAAQALPELMVYAALAAVVCRRWARGEGWVVTGVDRPVVWFAAWAVLCTAVAVSRDGAGVVPAAMNLRSLLRFAAVYWLVVQLGATSAQVRRTMWVIAGLAALQVAVVGLQLVAGKWVDPWLTPGASVGGRSFRLGGKGRELGAVYGTLGDTVFLAAFVLVGLAVWLTAPRGRGRVGSGQVAKWPSGQGGVCVGRATNAPIASCTSASHVTRLTRPLGHLTTGPLLQAAAVLGLLVTIAKTYSRAALLLAGLVLLTPVLTRLGARRAGGGALVLAAGVAGCVAVVGVASGYVRPDVKRQSIAENVAAVFSAEYVERAMNNRLGAVVGTAPTALVNRPVLGYGFDTEAATAAMNDASPSLLTKRLRKQGFEDVYWVAVLCYGGVPGLVLFGWVVMALGRAAYRGGWRSGDDAQRWAARAGVVVVLVAVGLMFFMRAMEFRGFGWYAWLLPALAVGVRGGVRDDAE